MNRKRVKELLPVFQAYADGKEIEFLDRGRWIGFKENNPPIWMDGVIYRIKPEPKKRLMTRGEVLYKVTNTPGMVVRQDKGLVVPAQCYMFESKIERYEWAIIDKTGESVDGQWHKFGVEENE
jgi:hypothetical protein